MVREDYVRVRQLFDTILAVPLEKTSSYFDKYAAMRCCSRTDRVQIQKVLE